MPRFAAPMVLAALYALPAGAETYSADVWADNWFELRIDGETVAVDSVPITTERSFNAESFQFEAEPPFVVGLIARDFIENDTGLEYIGTRRQQMGDGGAIVQIRDGAGQLVAVSDDAWRCLVVHTAPLDRSCERESNPVAGGGSCTFEAVDPPEGWHLAGFDASGWAQASVYSEREVVPRGGYEQIQWSDAAQLIWGPDLEQSNTVLCRLVVD